MDTTNKKHVLIIEDEPVILNMYVQAFEKTPYQIYTARDKESGMKMLNEKRPELILLDLLLPSNIGETPDYEGEPAGFDILRTVRDYSHTERIRVVIITNLDQPQFKELARSLGVDQYLVKAETPPHDITQKVEELLH